MRSLVGFPAANLPASDGIGSPPSRAVSGVKSNYSMVCVTAADQIGRVNLVIEVVPLGMTDVIHSNLHRDMSLRHRVVPCRYNSPAENCRYRSNNGGRSTDKARSRPDGFRAKPD